MSPTTIVLTFGAILLVGIVVSRWVTTFDLDSRTLAAAFGPLLLGFAGLTEGVVGRRSRWLRHLMAAVSGGWVALVVVLGISGLAQFESTGGASRTGRTYAAVVDELRDPALQREVANCQTYATDPLLAWLAGLELPAADAIAEQTPPFCMLDTEQTGRPAGASELYSGEFVALYATDE